MKYCIMCGKQIEDDVKTCPYCGSAQSTETMSATSENTVSQSEPDIEPVQPAEPVRPAQPESTAQTAFAEQPYPFGQPNQQGTVGGQSPFGQPNAMGAPQAFSQQGYGQPPQKRKSKTPIIIIIAVILVLAAVAGIIAIIAGIHNIENENKYNPPEEIEEDYSDYDINDSGLISGNDVYLGDAEMAYDTDGAESIVIHMTWTNNSTENLSAMDVFYVYATQQGSDLTLSTPEDEDYASQMQALTETVEPGTTQDIVVCFKLDDDYSDITVAAGPMTGDDEEISVVYSFE